MKTSFTSRIAALCAATFVTFVLVDTIAGYAMPALAPVLVAAKTR